MTGGSRPVTLAIVAGEESGDLLGADLARALAAMSGREIRLVGVGGRHLRELGLASLFDPAEIALMGLTAVLRDLPNLYRRIGQTARHVAEGKPDILVTIDSPAFNLRVARKVRTLAPEIPIVKYVCPSVWAWGPWRAKSMKPHTDHVLCLLPFEPAELQRLGGPPATFVGHRLASDPALLSARALQTSRSPGAEPVLLLLPGSRKSEVASLMDIFRDTLAGLAARGPLPRLLLPTVPAVAGLVAERIRDWPNKPLIVSGADEKWRAFAQADAALAASGTVVLELGLVGVPTVSVYRTDALVAWLGPKLVTTWTASLPNLIADRVVVPEYVNDQIRPQRMARHLEQLLAETPERAAQLDGFAEVRRRMTTERPSGALAAGVVMKVVGNRQ